MTFHGIWENDALVADLKAECVVGGSYGDIAARLASAHGIALTKNQVLAKASRLGLVKAGTVRIRKIRAKARPARFKQKSHVPMPPIERAPVPQFTCTPVPLLELRDGQCRFEVSGQDDPAKYLFCANPVAGEGISWCPDHCRVVFQPRKRS